MFRVYSYDHDGYNYVAESSDLAEAFTIACHIVVEGNSKWGLEAAIHLNQHPFATIRREGAKELLRLLAGS